MCVPLIKKIDFLYKIKKTDSILHSVCQNKVSYVYYLLILQLIQGILQSLKYQNFYEVKYD